MNAPITLAERLSVLKLWQIAAAGGLAVLAGLFAVAGVAHLGYGLFSEWGWVALFHIAASGAAYWFISRPFIEAYLYRQFLDAWTDVESIFAEED